MENEQVPEKQGEPRLRRRLMRRVGIAAGVILFFLGLIWLAGSKNFDEEHAAIMVGPPARDMTILLAPSSFTGDLTDQMEEPIAKVLSSAAQPQEDQYRDVTVASFQAALFDVAGSRSNWNRLKFQIGKRIGVAMGMQANYFRGPKLRISEPVYLRRTPSGAFYISSSEGLAGALHSDLIVPGPSAARRVARILQDYWAGWPVTPAPARAATAPTSSPLHLQTPATVPATKLEF